MKWIRPLNNENLWYYIAMTWFAGLGIWCVYDLFNWLKGIFS